MDVQNANINGVTITFKSAEADRVSSLLGLDPQIFYKGWITKENPSPCKTGFYVVFESELVFADFHNIPFYYQSEGYSQYMESIVISVTKDSRFSGWTGPASRFNAAFLIDFISLLSGTQIP
jgi:hypothetical protein